MSRKDQPQPTNKNGSSKAYTVQGSKLHKPLSAEGYAKSVRIVARAKEAFKNMRSID